MVLEQIMAGIFDNLSSGIWKVFLYFTPMFQVDNIMISCNQKDCYGYFPQVFKGNPRLFRH